MSDATAAPRSRRRRPSGVAGRWSSRLLYAIGPVVLLVLVWQLGASWLARPRIYPPPLVVAGELATILSGEAALGPSYAHALSTLGRATAAFAVSFLLGSALGVVAGRSPFVFDYFSSVMWAIVAVPSIVWAFIFLVAMGITNLVPVSAISLLLTPIVLIYVAEGTKSIPKEIIELSESYKVEGLERVRHVYLPYLVPYLAASARVAFALCLKIIVVTEVVGLTSGIGFEISYWYGRVFPAPVLAWGICLIAVGLAIDYGIFAPIERRASRWRGSSQAEVADAGRTI